jgi:hypothetical protein
MIKQLVTDLNFASVLNQKNLHKRMLDRVLVLRFLAFYQLTYTKARNGLKSFLMSFLTHTEIRQTQNL